MELTQNDFEIIRSYILKICGIELKDDKKYLIEQRLGSIAKSLGCKTFAAFAHLISSSQDQRLMNDIIIAITTNETSFFRDEHPFKLFRNIILPKLCDIAEERKKKGYDFLGSKTNILCAGSSTGQEPYSLAIIVKEYFEQRKRRNLESVDVKIIAADISSHVLARAIRGEYSEYEVSRGLTDIQRTNYFIKKDDRWFLRDDIKKIVEFRQVNFIEPFQHLGQFDLIFCRNMMIYFNQDTKKRIVQQFHQMLSDDGFLIVGSTENLLYENTGFESQHLEGSILYQKRKENETGLQLRHII